MALVLCEKLTLYKEVLSFPSVCILYKITEQILIKFGIQVKPKICRVNIWFIQIQNRDLVVQL
jgi:hypothetical protein